MLWLMKLANASCCGNGKRDCDNLKIFLSPTSPCHCVTTTWHGTTSTLAFTNTTMNAHHGLHTPTSAPHQDNKWGDSMNGGTRRRCVLCPRLQGIFFFPFFLLRITNNFFTYRLIMMRPNVTTPPQRLQPHPITRKGPNDSIYSHLALGDFFFLFALF